MTAPLKDYQADPVYQEAQKAYKERKLDRAQRLTQELIKKYPEEERLSSFLDDIAIQQMLMEFNLLRAKNERIQLLRIIMTMVIGIFILGGVLFQLISNMQEKRLQQEQEAALLAAQNQLESLAQLEKQARQLFDGGNLQLGVDILNQIEAVDAEYAALPELRATQAYLTGLEVQYAEAQALMDAGEWQAALNAFNAILASESKYRDVSQKIKQIDKQIRVEELIRTAQEAFDAGNWTLVIESYEEALRLSPEVLDDSIKQELIPSYVESIVALLDKDITTIEEVELAESYYKSALAMIPQSKAYERDREELDNLIVNLLVLKYTQYAKQMLIDEPYSLESVGLSIKYYDNAYRLNPENTTVDSDVVNTELYRSALKDFYEFDWAECVKTLEQLKEQTADFTGGKIDFLLYEAYMAYGRQKASYGLYADARLQFEKAEFLAWKQEENDVALFEVEAAIAYSYGKTHQYDEAVSYYQYALDVIRAESALADERELLNQLVLANDFAAQGLNFEAFGQYASLVEDAGVALYTQTEVFAQKGQSLLSLAEKNNSTIQAIINANLFSSQMTAVARDGDVKVPIVP